MEAIERENRDRIAAEKKRRQAAEQKAYRLAMLVLISAQDNLVKLAGYALASDFTPRRVSTKQCPFGRLFLSEGD